MLATREKLDFFIHAHFYDLMIGGPGLCALILSEGRAKDDTFGAKSCVFNGAAPL